MANKNIDNTDNGTGVFNTKVPGMDEAADIQEALRIYHYGSKTPPATEADIVRPSLVGHIKDIKTDIAAINAKGIGSTYTANEPSSIVDGMIWVDSDLTGGSEVQFATSQYQTTAPTTGLVNGLIWIKKGTSPLEMWVYDSSTTVFVKVGA
jgi:hypothetical protein